MKYRNSIARPVIGICALIVAVAVGLGLGALPVTAARFDMSASRLSTPSESTLERIRGIDEPVTIYTFEGQDNWLIDLSHRSAAASEYLTVEPGTQALAAEYGLTGANAPAVNGGSVLLVSKDRHYFLDNAKAYTYSYGYDYATGGYGITGATYHGESALSNALHYVTRDDMPVIYALSGHGEAIEGTYIDDALISANAELITLDLTAAGRVPENCAALIIYGPQADISAAEKALLSEYLAAGGKVILMTDLLAGELVNLFSLAEGMGLSADMGVVLENQGDYYFTYSGEPYPQYLRPELADSAITSGLIEQSTQIMMPLAHSIRMDSGAPGTLTLTELVHTSDAAYVKANINQLTTYDPEEGDPVGRFTLGAMARQGDSALCWFSSANWMTDNVESMIGLGNRKLLTAVLGEMVALPEVAEHVERPLAPDALEMPMAARAVYGGLCIAVPVAALIAAIVAGVRRRRVYA